MGPPLPPAQPPQRSPGGAPSSLYTSAPPQQQFGNAPPPVSPQGQGSNSLGPLRHPPPPPHMDERAPTRDRERWWQSNAHPPPLSSAAHRSDVMNMNSILGGGMQESADPRAAPNRYEERDRDRRRDADREREREREREWERERERERARASHYAGPPGRPPPPSPGSERRSPVSSFKPAASPRRRSDAASTDEAAYHRDREWDRERDLERDRDARWRASQRPGATGRSGNASESSHSRHLSGEVRYGAMSGPERPRSPAQGYPPSMNPRKSPIPGHPAYTGGARGVAAGNGPPPSRARQASGDGPLPSLGRESSPPRHAGYGHYEDQRASSLHGGMPPPHRSPERMRPRMAHGGYESSVSDREREREYEREMRAMEARDRDREMMPPNDRYGRRIHPAEHGAPHMMMDDSHMYDRYGQRVPGAGGPAGPSPIARPDGRDFEERGPPSLPYPPSSPTHSRDSDRIRKERQQQGGPPPIIGAPRDREQADYLARESSAPVVPRHRDERGLPPPHYDAERPPRPPSVGGPPPSSETGMLPNAARRPNTLSPTIERGAPFREGPPAAHRGPSMPPYAAGPPSDRDHRERDMSSRDQRELDFVQQERERERERKEREQRGQREQQLERERELQLEMERDRGYQQHEKDAVREKKERRRERQLQQQAEKQAAAERERQAMQSQQQPQSQMPGEGLHGPGMSSASMEEALIITAQQQAAAYGRAPTLADFQQAAAAVGYPPGMPLPHGLLPPAFTGLTPSQDPAAEAQALQPHVVRDPNAGPRVDSEPVWLYLELCERDEAIRRSQRLPLDATVEEPKVVVELEPENTTASAPQAEAETDAAPVETAKTVKEPQAPVGETLPDPLSRHLIGMDKGRPVRHLGSWIYDSTVDPLFPAELLARNVGATLEVRIPGSMLSTSSLSAGAGPIWNEYLKMEATCLARCQIGEELKAYMDGESCQLALNGPAAADSWTLGWRGKEHARMSIEMRIEERLAEAQLFGKAVKARSTPTEADGKKPDGSTDNKDETRDEDMPSSDVKPVATNEADSKTAAEEATVEAATEQQGTGSAWDFWRLTPLLRRKLWGTDVYTDDSDVLAMCVHAGWVEGPSLEQDGVPAWVPPGRAARAWTKISTQKSITPISKRHGEARQSSDLSVILRIAPKLIAYKGCQRGGIKSRSWGNTHDGVSLVVESVELKAPGYAHGKGRASAKRRIDQLALAANTTALVPASKRVAQADTGSATEKRFFWDLAVPAQQHA